MIMKDYKADEGLQGNDKIEKAIAGLQKETTQEMLAHTLTVVRTGGLHLPVLKRN